MMTNTMMAFKKGACTGLCYLLHQAVFVVFTRVLVFRWCNSGVTAFTLLAYLPARLSCSLFFLLILRNHPNTLFCK